MSRMTRKKLKALADEKGFLYRKGRKNPTIQICEDGTIIRADTDLTLCKAMTVKEAYETLGIKEGS